MSQEISILREVVVIWEEFETVGVLAGFIHALFITLWHQGDITLPRLKERKLREAQHALQSAQSSKGP